MTREGRLARPWWSALGLALALTSALAGCGRSGPERAKLHGTITFDGGPPPADGVVLFLPVNNAGRHGRANFAAGDGAFEATSIQAGDGLAPGTYAVSVECWKVMPLADKPGVSHVPKGFKLPDLEVKQGESTKDLNIDVPKAK